MPETRQSQKGLRRLRVEEAGAEDADLFAACFGSADSNEGIKAFLGKRKPDWQER